MWCIHTMEFQRLIKSMKDDFLKNIQRLCEKKSRSKQICSVLFHSCEYIGLTHMYTHTHMLKIKHGTHQILNSDYFWEIELLEKRVILTSCFVFIF